MRGIDHHHGHVAHIFHIAGGINARDPVPARRWCFALRAHGIKCATHCFFIKATEEVITALNASGAFVSKCGLVGHLHGSERSF